MIRNRKLLRGIAAFLILETLFNTIAPTVSWALTAGPTAPEFSSFEPVDTTDMVNLATGELVYNMPLIEVPGPSGGYAMSLSYHAGIKPDQESSWVGLGWSLNPGAINRTVTGFADDNVNVRREVRDYWDGGETTTKTYSIGINSPKGGIAINYHLAKTHDTFKGFSSNMYASVTKTIGIGKGKASSSSNLVGPLGITVSSNRGLSAATSIGAVDVEMDNRGISGSIDPITYIARTSKNAGLVKAGKALQGVTGGNSLGFSIGSNGVKASLTVAGQAFDQKNSHAGAISSYSNVKNIGSFGCGLGNISLKEYYTRYWSDQSDALYSFGSLYSAKNSGNQDVLQQTPKKLITYANDVYDLYDQEDNSSAWDWFDHGEPAKQLGGSLLAYDQYSVVAQGLSGMIEPFIFENGDIKGQNFYGRDHILGEPNTGLPLIKYKSLKAFTANKKVDFRFKNDFSNSLTIDPAQINTSQSDWSVPGHTVSANSEGYLETSTKQQLAGSKHIEWFTNQQIRNGSAQTLGFIDCYANKEDRPVSMEIYTDYLQPEACASVRVDWAWGKAGNGITATDTYPENSLDYPGGRYNSLKPRIVSLNDKIGGFMITNESGVTYHYAQPVYGYNEYTRVKLKNPEKDVATITEVRNDEPYAYTWLLTAITGPDYVDRGTPGILDDADYGYWVKFDYGKWTDSYQWRTPHTGYKTDIENEYASFSYGIKELYYLDAIETTSHKAFFVKSKRKDGRGVTSRLEGGSNPRRYTMRYRWTEDLDGYENDGAIERARLIFSVSPVSMLKLDAVYLFDKKDISSIPVTKAGGDKYDNAPISNPYMYPFNEIINGVYYTSPPSGYFPETTLKEGEDFMKVKYHNGDLVFDDEDLLNLETYDFKKKALRTIVFKTDYSLASVPNSIGYFSDLTSRSCYAYQSSCTPAEAVANKKLDFEWPYSFGTGCLEWDPVCCDETDSKIFYSSDPLLKYDIGTGACADSEYDFAGSKIRYPTTGKLTMKEISILGKEEASLIPPTKFAYNKNAGYSDKIDEWGFYKSDYTTVQEAIEGTTAPDDCWGCDGGLMQTIDGTRKITSASAGNVDVWSLNTITTSLGGSIDITYEPNTYVQSVYNNDLAFGIRKAERVGTTDVKLYFTERGLNLNTYFQIDQYVDVKALIISDAGTIGDPRRPTPDIYDVASNRVTSIGSNFIQVTSSVLNEYLKQDRQKTVLGTTRTLTPYFISAAVRIPGNITTNKFGGGIRVKSISTNVFGGHTSMVEYDYNKPGSTVSSGVTSYVPFNMIGAHFPDDIDFFDDIFTTTQYPAYKREILNAQTDYLRIVNKLNGGVMVFNREAPAPGVLYEFVAVRNKYDGNEQDHYIVNQFKVFKESMITINKTNYGGSYDLREVRIENNAVDVGNLVKTSTYSRDNKLLTETKYGYLYDDEEEDFETPLKAIKQGVVEQAFQKRILVQDFNFNNESTDLVNSVERAVVTKRKDRSNVLTSVEQYDVKNGVSVRTEHTGFDYYTGLSTTSVSVDPSGNRYQTTILPAYKVEDYSGMTEYHISNNIVGMGLKLRAPKNKHMLTQQASSITTKLEGSVPVALLSAAVQTWSDQLPALEPNEYVDQAVAQPGIWRKSANYSFIGSDNAMLRSDGLYPIQDVTAFTAWNDASTPAGWQKDGGITLYNVNSQELEAIDLNGHYAATRMSLDNSKVIATVANARYNEFAYSGAEELESTNVNAESDGLISIAGERLSNKPHTGLYSVYAIPGAKAISYYLKPDRLNAYTISLWTTNPNIALKYEENGTPVDISKKIAGQAGEWYLVEGAFSTSGSIPGHIRVWVEAVGASAYIDDFRFFPTNASMVSYVYSATGELSHILDSNNLFTEFKYDVMGRLEETFKETFSNGRVRTGRAIYHYANQND